VIVHVAPRIGGPQGRPAGPHRGEKRRLVVDTEKAFELAGEVRTLAILDQRGGTYRTRLAASCALGMPGAAQGFDDVRPDRLFIERKPDLDRQPALLPRIGRSESANRIVKTKRSEIGR